MPQVKINAGILPLVLEKETDAGFDEEMVSINMDSFFIDQYEVNNEALCKCVKASECMVNNINYICDVRSKNMPVNNIRLADAQNFCEWLGRRLPLEIEWEMAAKDIDKSELSRKISQDILQINNTELGKTKDNVYALYTNVSEWTLSEYSEGRDFSRLFWKKENPISNVIIKGSDFSYNEIKSYYFRTNLDSSTQIERVGFRCVSNKAPTEVLSKTKVLQ